MLTVARSSLADRDLAEEAVQQAFVQAWNASNTYDPERPLSTWLYAITRRVCIDLYRRERRHALVSDTGELPEEVAVEDEVAVAAERSWQAWRSAGPSIPSGTTSAVSCACPTSRGCPSLSSPSVSASRSGR